MTAPVIREGGDGHWHLSFVMPAGMSFEVDSRYAIKSVIGKGAYGLVCAAEDSLAASNNPSPASDASFKSSAVS